MGFDSKHDFAPSTIFLGLLLCLSTWGIFFWWDQHSPSDGCSAVSCKLGVLTGEDECTSFYSAILNNHIVLTKPHPEMEFELVSEDIVRQHTVG